MPKLKISLFIILILVLALVLRFWDLTKADVITDESLIAFRSIGLIDFLASPDQTTPWEWFLDKPIAGWAKLSFHDHPPLVFWLQHFSFLLFGQNLLALRLPFVLAGIFSVFLIYLIGKKLFDQKVGLLAGFFLSICSYHIWISKIGLQESLVIFFCLLTFYLFLKSLDTKKYWQWGIALGLALLTKYTALVILPIILIYLLIYYRPVFKTKTFWFGPILGGLIFSPVLIYNFKLNQTFGHFDLQFSYLFGQKVSAWQSLPGKAQIGSLADRIINLPISLYNNLSLPFFILIVISLILLIYFWFKQKNQSDSFLLIAIICHCLLFLIIGFSMRFVVVLIPYLILVLASIVIRLDILRYKLVILFLLTFGLFELFFSYNSLIASYPFFQKFYSPSLRTESYRWGYNQLDSYLTGLLKDQVPEVSLQTRYKFLEEIKNQSLAKAKEKNLKPKALLLVYDSNMYDLATLWLWHRRLVYQGWPIITADTYLQQEKTAWQKQGITDFYFIKILDQNILQQPIGKKTEAGTSLEAQLNDLPPKVISRPDGKPVFAVYRW
ncbi:MAG: glycosyltransferase family 39 protein [Candidatus Buchananbacteria bacterium]